MADVSIDQLLMSLQDSKASDSSSGDLDSISGGGPPGIGGSGRPPGMGDFMGDPMGDPFGGLPGMGCPPGVSLEDTFKSNVNSGAPGLGASINPMAGSADAFLEDTSAPHLGGTQTVQTSVEEIENPYAFPMDNTAQEAPNQVEETVGKTKKIVGAAAIGILVVIVIFAVVVGVKNKISEVTKPKKDTPPTSQGIPAPKPGGSDYTGPRIQTAEPNAVAVGETVYDDVMAITKVIQVENGSVECYLVGTPQYFEKKIKIPVTVEEYNKAVAADIVKIQYKIVKISGQDFVIDPVVVKEDGE